MSEMPSSDGMLKGTAIVCLLLLASILGPLAWLTWHHVPGWYAAGDAIVANVRKASESLPATVESIKGGADTLPGTMHAIRETTAQLPETMASIKLATDQLPATMASVKEAADTSNDSSTEVLDLIGSGASLVDDVRRQVDDVMPKAGNTITALGNSADAATDTIGKVGTTADAATGLIGDPAIRGTLTNVDTITELAARKERDLFYPPPCTGSLCPIKKVWRVGRAIIGLAEPTYYGVGIARGE